MIENMGEIINDISELNSKESFYQEKIDEIYNQRDELAAGLCENFFTYIINKAGIATKPKDLLVEDCYYYKTDEGYAHIQFQTSYLENVDSEQKLGTIISYSNSYYSRENGTDVGPAQEFLRIYMSDFVKSIIFKRTFFICFAVNLFTIENANIIAENLVNIKKELDKLSDSAPCGFSFEI